MKVFLKIAFFLFPVFLHANTLPNVDAGPIKRIIFPTSSTILTGSGSDKEGPVTFKWKQAGGNSTALIADSTKGTTAVSKLKPGLYTFVLTVTDNSGASRKDTTYVSVYTKLTWTIGNITREALVHPPTGGSGPAPIVFAFHGHGGTDSGFAERMFEQFWPEAIVVYPQGLRTKTPVDTICKLAGWQTTVGEVNCHDGVVDQDLKFFDTMMVTLKKKFSVNSSLVFAHGWSNGADFVYDALWAARGSKLAAIAPAGATLDTIVGKKPKPVIHIAGTKDVHVLFPDQQQSVQEVRTLDKCSSTGTIWATGPSGLLGTRYDSPINAPVVFLQYEGDHSYPFTVPQYIIKFFKEVASAKPTPLITKVTPVNKYLIAQ